MAAEIIPAGYGRAAFKMGGTGLPNGGEVTLGFSNPTPLSLAEVLTNLGGAFQDHVMPVLTDDITFTALDVKLGPNDVGPTGSIASGTAGSIVGNSCPPNVAILIHKITAIGGHKGRGRWYLPGLGEGTVDNGGFILVSAINDYNTAMVGFFNALVAADLLPYVLHRDATTPTEVTLFSCDARAATQRDRLRRR